MNSATTAWPQIYAGLQNGHGTCFVVDDERFASFDLSLAAMATDMQALENIFPVDQADRLRRFVLNVLNTPEYGEYCAQELDEYRSAWRDALEGPEPLDVMSSIPARLLHRWLGPRIREFTVRLAGRDTDILSPLLVTHVTIIVMGFVGFWKGVRGGYKLVPGDFPPDYKFGSQ